MPHEFSEFPYEREPQPSAQMGRKPPGSYAAVGVLDRGEKPPSGRRFSVALVFLRIASGLAFLYHGSAILFGAFGGPGPVRFAAGMHAPAVVGYLVGLAQFCGALAILSGVFFRIGAACIAIVMLGAIFLVHLPHGFNIGNGGMEYALTQLLMALAFLFTGPGAISLSRALPHALRKL